MQAEVEDNNKTCLGTKFSGIPRSSAQPSCMSLQNPLKKPTIKFQVPSILVNNNQHEWKHSHQGFIPTLTHLLWTLTTLLIYSGSIVLLCLMGYIEMFSSYLMESGFFMDVHLLPFLIIVSVIPINMIMHKVFINNKDSHSFAHGILSSIYPCR